MISSMASITSSSSATVRVEKATSEFLIGPDWTMNIDICDTINSNQMLAKDVVKAVKKRLQHKKPKVQLLALTLLETMVQNCGDYVHFQIAERNILPEMVKIVKKKTDMHVRDKILSLLASWNEAFGGSSGRYPQYYMAYEDLRRYGVAFPQVSPNSVPIITPPVTRPVLSRHPQPGYGMPSSSSTRLDQVMAADDSLSLSSISSMREVVDLLADMLLAVDPHDRSAVKDEVIMDLVEQCRANQKKLMKTLTSTTGDEELLAQGLEMNDKIQFVLSKHDAIASGSALPVDVINTNPEASVNHEVAVNNEISPKSTELSMQGASALVEKTSATDSTAHKSVIDEDEEEEDDDFALLARRHSNTRNGDVAASEKLSIPVSSYALVPVTSHPSVTQTKDQDVIDLLSLTLSTEQTPPQTHTSPPPTVSQNQTTLNDTNQGTPFSNNSYPQNQGLGFNSYVAPWARAQQPQMQAQSSQQPETRTYPNLQAQQPLYKPGLTSLNQPLFPNQGQQFQPQQEVKSQPQSTYLPQEVNHYPPPPWATTPGYYSSQSSVARQPYTFSNPRPMVSSSNKLQPLRHDSVNGDAQVNNSSFGSPRSLAPSGGHKPFIPSYRLFEDLDVFGNNDARFKAGNSASTSLSGSNNNQSMVWGRK